jgi:hypothetical protein
MAFNFFGISIPQISLPKISLPSLPSLPKVSLPAPPKIEIPKITVPDVQRVIPKIITSPIPVVAVAGAVGESVAGAVAGGVPEIKLPTPPKVELPKISLPKIDLPKPAWSGAGTVPGRIITPEEAARTGIPTGGVTVPAGGGGGNLIDTIINARDKSYSDSTEHIGAGNIPRGGAQFGATAAADVLLPMDLADAANKWATGRGDQIDGELALWAAIDAVTLAAAPFTFGASYAAGRALKGAKVVGKVGKTAKGVEEMGKSKVITKAIGAMTGAGKTSSGIKPLKVAAPGVKVTSSTSNISTMMRKQAEAAQKQYASLQAQYGKMVSALKAPKSAPIGATKGLKPAAETSKAAGVLGKTGTALKYTGLGLGAGAIGLTALGALGSPAPMIEPPPENQNGGGGNGLGGADQSGGTGGGNWWDQFLGGETYDPSLYEGYDPYAGNYETGYPDPLGIEPYAQDLLSYAEEVPVVGGVATAAKQSGFALPALIGAVVLVVLVVAVLRSKKGKAMISGVTKKVSSATKGAKKAVTG